MPAALAKSIDLSVKPKRIVFDNDGDKVVTKKTEERNKNVKKAKKNAGQEQQQRKEHVAGHKTDLSAKPKRIVFDDDGNENNKPEKHKKSKQVRKDNTQQQQLVASNGSEVSNKNKKTAKDKEVTLKKPQKIKFSDDGTSIEVKEDEEEPDKHENNNAEEDDDDYFAKREQLQRKKQGKYEKNNDDDAAKKWYYVYTQYPCSDEVLDMKENEQMELFNLCKSSFEAEKHTFFKRNPSDARWLHTALHKGTAKDRANAGALLVTSNPLGNLEALSTLIGFCKLSNKANVEVINIMTDLWKEVLLPPKRKLVPIQMRGADWKHLRKDETITKEKQKRIYAYWYFENELKDNYFEFLKNVMQGLQTGQENNKNCSIVAASQLLAYAPEKEQMLLTMLINKLGDPVAKIASKALHHLTEVAHRHPNMCGVIVAEAEKLLFRNNISDRAQHFALCFLASIAPAGHADVCTKLVNICFSLFKVLVQKGAVNNRTMQAILRCLQKAILEAKPANGSTEILNKEMQDTIYRLVHLADMRVSVQTLGLLLQLITVKTEKSDRFYNALYIKLLDLNLINIGSKTAAQLLHIVHRAVHIDKHAARAQAFVKRLLQLALYTTPQVSAGCLIVLHKLLRNRRELLGVTDKAADGEEASEIPLAKVSADDAELAKFDSDGEEKYEDVTTEKNVENTGSTDEKEDVKTTTSSSWHHAKVSASVSSDAKVREIGSSKYDPYHRVPAFAGAELAQRNELHLLRQHYHPTVQVFAENILNQKRIEYYGDPLRDFGLPHFLERFAFKNPKKLEKDKAEAANIAQKRYVAHGARGKPVKSLTKITCTEDEMYIFNFLEHKRKQAELVEKSKKSLKKTTDKDNEDADDLDETAAGEELMDGEVDDNEFEAYLDGYFGKKAKKAADEEEMEDEDLDFLQELGGELIAEKSKNKKKNKKATTDNDEDVSDIEADWGDEHDDAEFEGEDMSDDDDAGSIDLENEDDDDDDDGSVSLDEPMNDDDDDDTEDDDDDNDDDDNDDDDDDELSPPKTKKSRRNATGMDERGFSRKLKNSTDMSSLFAAADDFAEMLEETSKTKGQGTVNAVYNKDKSSDKQLKWEEKRRSNTKNYTNKKHFGKTHTSGKKFAQKRKH